MKYDTKVIGKRDIEIIASICHNNNKIYCESIGDYSQVEWDYAPENIKQSAIDGVKAVISGVVKNPGDSHRNWLKFKEQDGWVYGPVKDMDKKEHPCMVPFEELPEDQKIKDELFLWTVREMLTEFGYEI